MTTRFCLTFFWPVSGVNYMFDLSYNFKIYSNSFSQKILMKKSGIILPVLVSLVPFCMIVLSIFDISSVLTGNNAYPFNSEFFGKFSIYNSKSAYLIINVIYTLVFIFSIYYAFKSKWKLFCFYFGIGIVMLLYPMLTN